VDMVVQWRRQFERTVLQKTTQTTSLPATISNSRRRRRLQGVLGTARKRVRSRNIRRAQKNEKEEQGNVGGERYLARHRTVTTSKNLLTSAREREGIRHSVPSGHEGEVECSESGVATGRDFGRLL
jgi:hypothetical protein